MTDFEGYVAFYGAALSSILAVVAIWDKLRETNPFRITRYSDTHLPSRSISAHLTNMSLFTVAIDGVWLGYAYRAWYWPFRRRLLEGAGMNGYDVESDKQIYLEAKLFAPGAHLMVDLNSNEMYKARQAWFGKEGFDYRLCIVVDHSLSRKSQVLMF